MALMTLYVEAPRSAARIKRGKSVLFGNSVSRSYREQFLFFFLSRFVPFFFISSSSFSFSLRFFRFSELMFASTLKLWEMWYERVSTIEFVPLIPFMIILIIAHLIVIQKFVVLRYWYEKNCSFFLDISYYIFSFMLEAWLCSSIIIGKFIFILNMKYNDMKYNY